MAEAYYEDAHIKIYNKDCRDMSELPGGSVQMVCTSPPYWGLRKYSGEQELVWGGDKDCEHQWGELLPCHHPGQVTDAKAVHNETTEGQTAPSGQFCSLCGAWKGAYGLEPTPEMYVQHTIEILREIRRVLRKDGVVFWNIGDTYATHASGSKKTGHNFRDAKTATEQGIGTIKRLYGKNIGLKEKDLCLIPFRLAIACQEDGWWVRSVIIWSKPNPMPESVTDRPTESHEYILMLTKSARYYWDADAVREPYSPTERWGGDTYKGAVKKGNHGEDGGLDRERSVYPQKVRGMKTKGQVEFGGQEQHHGLDIFPQSGGRNIRSVWEFPTQPYPEAHFAVFPEKLPEICIKAASKENDLILDPFLGAGTTAWVAKKLNRRCIGYEISQEYCDLAIKRNRQQVMELDD